MALRELAEKLEVIHKIDPEGTTEIAQMVIEKLEEFQRNMINMSGEYLHGDTIHEEDPAKVKALLDSIPQALTVKNEEGSLPKLSLALKYGVNWTEELSGVIHAQGSALGTMGKEDGLFPFLQAVVGGCELSVVYDLLRRYPDALRLSLLPPTPASTTTETSGATISENANLGSIGVDQDSKRAKTHHNETE